MRRWKIFYKPEAGAADEVIKGTDMFLKKGWVQFLTDESFTVSIAINADRVLVIQEILKD